MQLPEFRGEDGVFFFKFIFIGVLLLYNIVLVFIMQWNVSAIG